MKGISFDTYQNLTFLPHSRHRQQISDSFEWQKKTNKTKQANKKQKTNKKKQQKQIRISRVIFIPASMHFLSLHFGQLKGLLSLVGLQSPLQVELGGTDLSTDLLKNTWKMTSVHASKFRAIMCYYS